MTEITRHHITSGDLDITINANGSVARIKSGDMQVSQYVPGIHDAGIAGVWLRRRDGENIESIPLTGFESASRCSFGGGTATWSGNGLGVDWTAKLVIIDSNEWAWNVTANPSANGDAGDYEWDLVVAQDLALAPIEQALTSEPYISQYIAYHVENDDKYGKVLAARQTMSAAPKLPSFTMMIAEGASAWLTDGFDFYGRTARAGEQPVALTDPDWGGGRTNQFEFGMACLLSKPRSLGEGLQWTILNHFDADDRNEMSDICTTTVEKVENILDRLDLDLVDFADSTEIKLPDNASILAKAPALNGDELDEQALLAIGGGKATSPERNGEGKTLSYFSDHARHVVSGEKEMNVDRSHGQILLAGGVTDPSVPAFAATTYAPGVFASHIVLGNTNMNRLVSVHRTSLNLLRSQGVRILVRLSGRDDEAWRMLSVPSAYVMDLGGSRWVYQIGDERIVVETVASSVESAMDIALTSTCEIDALMTIDIENPEQWALESSDNCVTMIPAQGTLAAERCTQLGYAFTSDGDSNYVETETMPSFVATRTHGMHVAFAASEEGGASTASTRAAAHAFHAVDADAELERHARIISEYVADLDIANDDKLEEFNLSLPWFVQNALVHFLSPHGLEQYSGAAWGTRDVCQGPFEMALAFGHFDAARTIIRKVFSHQNEDGSLPQWFMFDQYASIYQHDSHGDIPVWPLMVVGEYLDATGDATLLDDIAPFWDNVNDKPCDGESTVADHLRRTLDYIRSHRVPGTELFSYGEGDWDDTLQPAQAEMKKSMASTWTIALLYQATSALARLLPPAGADELAKDFKAESESIRSVYDRVFVFDDVLAGYVHYENGEPEPIIHPRDTRTGIKYRLIPMTRSIIAGLFSPQEERLHEGLIEDNLHYPDGVRLMNRPAAFHDGETTVFKRGEQAANVGREIGLMYTHAHIRYTEALSLLGRGRVGDELLRISPVNQFKRLPTSEPRQRNCYFASSDADFPDRYTASAQWDRLKDDAANPVGVRGGWRVYSSGPGIYLRQVVQHLLGIQIHADRVTFDPVLTTDDDGLEVTISLFGTKRTIRYHVADVAEVTVSGEHGSVDGQRIELPYRAGGLSISREALGGSHVLDVTVPNRG